MERRNKKTKSKGNGEGTIYFSETLQKYVAQYIEPSTGKRKTLTQRKNEGNKEFKDRFNKIMNDINQGTYVEKSNDTCLSIIKNYVEQKYKDGITSDNGYLRDLGTIQHLEKTCKNWINKPIQSVSTYDIEQSKDLIRDYSNNTISKIWRFINKIFKIGISRRKIIYNPMDDETLSKPVSRKQDKDVEALTKEEEQKLLDVLKTSPNKQYNNIIKLQLYTGARIGEILALSRDCVDLKNNTLTIYRTTTKNKNENFILGEHTKTYNKKTRIDKGKRCFPMTPQVRQIINEVLSSKTTNMYNLLFWNYSRNKLITYGMIDSYLKRINIGKDNKIKITEDLSTHKLRHTFITRCQENGMPLVVLQSLVGHVIGSSITNDTYTSVSLDFMKQELKKIN